jgi:hypothetical protein
MIRPVFVLGGLVATLVVVLGTADATAGRPHPPAIGSTPGGVTTVRQATVVCPDVRGGAGHQLTWVRAAGTATVGTPSITATAVTSKPQDFVPADQALSLVPYGMAFGGRVDTGTRALELTATSPSAVGLGAIQVTRATGGVSRGLSADSCSGLGTEFAFVGGSTTVGNQLELVLTNVDDTPASVDVTLLGAKGPVTTPGTDGLMVKPHTRLGVELAPLGPDQAQLTTIVTAVTGRVAAAELSTSVNGSLARGIEWIPDAGASTRRAVIPGMLADSGRRTLVLANPGLVAANVGVQVVSSTGTFTPAGLNAVLVPASSVLTVDVTGAVAQQAGALLVDSDQPIYAGASQLVGTPGGAVADVTWSGQTPPLDGPAVLPVVPIDAKSKRDVWLYLSAVHGDGEVTITPNGLDATATPVTVHVPAGQTVTADLGSLLQAKAGDLSVLVSNDVAGGPVTASAVFRETTPTGLMAAQVGLTSVPGVVQLPSVVEDPTVAGARPGEIVASAQP